MVNPLLISMLGRGVWVAVGAGIGYLIASGKQGKTQPETGLMGKVESGHVAFVVKDYEVAKVLQPGDEVAPDEVPGIINVRFTGHLPQDVAMEVQRLLAKGRIKLGSIESAVDSTVKSQLENALSANEISEAERIIANSYGYTSSGQVLQKERFIEHICFWVWLIDMMRRLNCAPHEMERLGVTPS